MMPARPPAPPPAAAGRAGAPPAGAPQAGRGGGRGGPGGPIVATFASGKLRFEMAGRGRGGQNTQPPPPTVYEGSLAGAKFELTISGGPAPNPRYASPTSAILERSTREAFDIPRLPLPALHNVKSNGLAKTPPMGWNSWNLFAGRVDDKLVREMADAMITSGMKKAGYIYVNIDDTWEGESRDAKGNMTTNTKFPNMKALSDYVHSKGLKIGIYSSPGPTTCQHWGIDYLKYDWCGASRVYGDEDMHAAYQKMGDALLKSGRPIVYSLCQYGRAKVWEWGPLVGGNLWRTTGDIGDRWNSMLNLGFGPSVPGGIRQPDQPAPPSLTQLDIAKDSNVGHWNDPDMLEVGNGGMTTDEYKTHFSMWSMLRSPLLAGNDIRSMSQETKDILLKIARPLKDKSTPVALFNRGDQPAKISVIWDALGLGGKKLTGRDLWRHEAVTLSGDRYSVEVPTHGVVLLKVSAK
ncbi:MAG: glycoside hydrolase family 27 protein [Acidobacteriia bacterium]|nr:glycoside hydrolase family 27 protein [Terriglobia bacterium]